MTTSEPLEPTVAVVDARDPASGRVVVEGLTITAVKTGAQIVQDVTISVAAGEILGIVGESGSGKTTLGLAMIGHARRGLKVTAGSVRLDASDIFALSNDGRRRLRGAQMAYVPQDPGTALNPARKIGAQLREALRIHGRTKSEADLRVTELLAEVGLDLKPEVLRSYPHQLSGGQQQRIGIAMAFACRPSLIVLDEPTTGLDVTTQRTVLETIKRLCTEYGVAAIYVSHDATVVGELCDRVAVVYSGRIIESGPTDSVFCTPRHPYTRGLLAAVPAPDKASRLVGIDGVPPRPGQRPPGCSFAPRCPVSEAECHKGLPELVLVSGGLDTSRRAHHARCLLVGDSAALSAPASPKGVEDASIERALSRVQVIERPRSDTAPVLSCLDLSARYGHHQVLFDVNFELPQNECVAIVGESGSGKTTLARCLSGLHSNWDGKMTYRGQDLSPGIRQRPAEMLRKMQYIFQNPQASLNPRRTVGASIGQWLEQFTEMNRDERDDTVHETMKAVALSSELVNRYPDQLSGGERQRVAVARALAVSPEILICDEITSALDVSVQASVIELLRNLQVEKSLSMVFITHNLPLVRSIAQQVVVVSRGRVVESGPVEEVLVDPQHEYTQRLLANVSRFDFDASTQAG